MNALENLATGIFVHEFDSDTNIASYNSILGWLNENLGLLNTLINTNFEGVDAILLNEEQAIYKQIYLYNYYAKQARNVLRGIMGSGGNAGDNILSVKDGDNAITFTNKNEISKTYKEMAKDAKQTLDMMVAKYNIYASKPIQVAGIEAGNICKTLTLAPEYNCENNEIYEGNILDGGNEE
jgi:hypothetical protein